MRLGSVSLTGNSCVSGVAAVLYLSFTTSGWEHFLHIHFLCLCSSYFVNDPLPHGNNTTCGAMCYIISPAFLSAYEEVSSRSWNLFFLLRASHRSWKSQQIINTAVTFLCELCLSSAPCSQMVLGRLSYCELPWLIVQHVLVNQACPQWQLLSRHYNELPKPL